MAKKIEEKNPVGRPRLADSELIKDSWCRVGASLAIALVLVVCGVGVLTSRTPFQVLTFKDPNKALANIAATEYNPNVKVIKANSSAKVIPAKKSSVRVIPANSIPKRIIDANGNVTKVIPAKRSN